MKYLEQCSKYIVVSHILYNIVSEYFFEIPSCMMRHADEIIVSLFDADIKIKVLTPKDIPLMLECTNRSAGDKVQWLKEKVPLPTDIEDRKLIENIDIKMDNETGTLEILKEKEEVYGNYTCKAANSTTEYRVVRKYALHKCFMLLLRVSRQF